MSTLKATAGYRPDIDGLRAVAVLGVVIFHAFPAALPGGFIGVDIFFVISGYLISGLIFRALDRGQFSLADFYRRRGLRIFPGLILVLLCTLIYGATCLRPEDFARLGREVANGTFFVANFYFLSQAGYFDAGALTKPLLHLWSLGIEEQFYIVFPLSVLALGQRKSARTLALGAALAVSFALNLWVISHAPNRAFYLPWTRFWELLIGAMLANAENNNDIATRSGRASLLGLGFLLGALVLFNEGLLFPGAWALIPTCAAALIIASGPQGAANRFLKHPVAVFIGLISYPLYLWHWPLLAMFTHFNLKSHIWSGGALILSFALATLTQHFVEPRLRHPRKPTPTFITLFCIVLAIGIGGVVIYQTFEAGRRAEQKRFGVYATSIAFDWGQAVRRDECHLEDLAVKVHAESCVTPGDPRLMLWGDSQGASLYPGLNAERGAFGLAQFTQAGCAPLFDLPELTYRKDCNALNRAVFARAKTLRPQILLLAAAWFHEHYPLSTSERRARFRDTLAQVRTALPSTHLFVVGPPPRWTRSLQDLIVENMRAHDMALLPARSPSDLDPENESHDREMAALSAEVGVEYISLIKFLCNESGCLTRVGPAPTDLINVDGWHLSPAGSRYVAKRVMARVGRTP